MSAVKWYIIIQILGLFAAPIAFVCFHRCRDRGWAYAKLIGIMLPVYVTWLLAHYGLSYAFSALFLCVLLMALISGFLFWLRRKEFAAWWREGRSRIIGIEAVFLTALIFFGTVRAYNPEIESRFEGYGSEKFMDIMLINSVHESHSFPPNDAWLSGKTINYYWYGYYICSAMCKLTGTPTQVGYNLMLATIFALATTMAFALAWHLTGRWWAGIFAALGLTVLGNPQGFRLHFGWGVEKLSGVRYLWDCSRVINSGHTINEFPYFSFLWGDLHGHVTSLPFTILALACAGALWVRRKDPISVWILCPLLTALSYGSAVASNNWDLPAYAGVIVLTSLVFFPRTPSLRSTLSWAGSAALQRLLPVALGLAMFLPFFLAFDMPKKSLNFAITSKTPLVEFLSMFGYQGFLVGTLLVWIYLRCIGRDKRWILLLITLAVILSIPLGLYVSYRHTVRFETNPLFDKHKMFVLTGILIAGLLLVSREILRLAFPGFLERKNSDKSDGALATVSTVESYRFIAIILFVAMSILLGTEYIALQDFYGKDNERMNTLFKFHFEVWTMLALVGGWVTALVFGGRWGLSSIKRLIPKVLWGIPWLAVMGMCFFFTVKGTQIKTDRSYDDMKGRVAPTFDGRIWLAKDHPEDLAIIEWLQENGKNGNPTGEPPTILEAISDETYSYFGRISAFTGFPAVIGWPNHEGIWRSHDSAINKHKQDGRRIYNSSKLGESCRLTEEYGVDYIILGELEREEFPPRLLKEKFLPYTDVVFATGESSIRSKWNKPCDELAKISPEGFIDRTDETPPIPAGVLRVTATIGADGTAFKEPRGLTFGPAGRLYVCDSRNYRVLVYSPEGVLERTIPDPSETNERAKLGSQWGGPGDVAVTEDGTVYVADTWGSPPKGGYGRIVKYDDSGKFLAEWAGPQGFYGPRGIALSTNGNVYVSDTGNKRVQQFDANGEFVRTWGKEGNEHGEFIEPVGIAVYGDQVYVCDTGNQRVQAFDLTGRWLFEFVPYGWGGNTVSVEPHVSVDGEGDVYVTDSYKGYIEVFSPKGDPIRKCYRGLSRPSGIEIFDKRGAVSELGSNMVKVFTIE